MAPTLHEWLLRLWGTISRRRTDGDLEEELRLHLELAAEESRCRGESPDGGERAARIRAGGVTQAMEACRDQRGLPWLDVLARGVAGLPRLVRHHRGYFLFATTTLAVAVGVNLVVFTVVNALWLRPLPVRDADRLVTVMHNALALSVSEAVRSPFEAVAGQVETSHMFSGLKPDLAFDGVESEIEAIGVTPEYFGLFGVTPRGRDFTADDDRAGAEPVAIISDRLWSRAFGRRPDLIGAVAAAKPFAIRIVGIAPAGFEGVRRGERVDVWIPSRLVPKVASDAGAAVEAGDHVPMMVFARLLPGQTPADVTRRWRETGVFPEDILASFAAVPLKDVFGTPESRTIVICEGNALAVVAGLAMLVLAGGCATLAALVLVHYERRRRELAVRTALGASRRRLTGELALELGLVAAAGTMGALMLAVSGLRAIPALTMPGGVNLARLDLSIDWRVLGVAVAAAIVTLAAAASLPIRRFTRARLAQELIAGPVATAPAASQRIRQALLALQVSATIVVLVAAGLFVRAVVHGFGHAPGFDIDRTKFVTVQLPPAMNLSAFRARTPKDENPVEGWKKATAARATRLREALRSLPGVAEVAEGMPPIDPDQAESLLAPRAVDTWSEHHELRLGMMRWSPEWLSALGVPILAGRGLTPADATSTPAPAVVTASLARMLWPAGDALGQPFFVKAVRSGGRHVVVGIARDFVVGSLTRPAAGVVVTAAPPTFGIEHHFAVRTAHPDRLVEPMRRAVKAIEPDTPRVKVTTGRDIIARDIGRQRLGAWFFSWFGLTALILGVGGVFGLTAYLAESRYREFGVRLALGATPHDLVRHGLSAALVPTSLGVGAGLVAAAVVARLFTSLLTGLSALDPTTYGAVAGLMLSCAVLAGLGGAWRLRRMAPVDALRTD